MACYLTEVPSVGPSCRGTLRPTLWPTQTSSPMMSSILNRIPVIAVNRARSTGAPPPPPPLELRPRPPLQLNKPGLKPSRRAFSIMTGGFFAAGGRSDIAVARQAAGANPEIAKVLVDPKFPDAFPFGEQEMQRYDESSDFLFYSQPRLGTAHRRDAIGALTKYYAEVFPESGREDTALLDVCSSWISHYPKDYKAGRISGLGMNEEELGRNPILSDYAVRDLNEDPTLPYEDNTFDVVTNAVSVDYLTKPLEMMKEVNRVLKPGGLAVMSFSNRCFPTKAVSIWTATGDLDHIWIVGAYFHFAGGFEPPAAQDISPKPGKTDPMYVVYARKKA